MTTQAGDLLTVREAARRLGVTADAVYQLCRERRIEHYRFGCKGGSIKIRPEALDAYAESCRVEARPQARAPRARPGEAPLRHFRPPA